MARMTEAQREAHNARRRIAPTPKRCIACGKTFTPKRSDAKTCSALCRQRFSRMSRLLADKRDTSEEEVREQNAKMRRDAEAEVAAGSTCPVPSTTANMTDEEFAKQDEAFVHANLEPWRAAGVSEAEIEAMFANFQPGVRAAYYRLR